MGVAERFKAFRTTYPSHSSFSTNKKYFMKAFLKKKNTSLKISERDIGVKETCLVDRIQS